MSRSRNSSPVRRTATQQPVAINTADDFATPGQTRVALEQVRTDARAILEVGRVVGPEYVRGDAPFQDQLHVRAHVLDFLSNHALMLLEWANRTEAISTELSTAERNARALQVIEGCLARYPEQ